MQYKNLPHRQVREIFFIYKGPDENSVGLLVVEK